MSSRYRGGGWLAGWLRPHFPFYCVWEAAHCVFNRIDRSGEISGQKHPCVLLLGHILDPHLV